MATRTPHTGVAGEVLTAANLAKYPKGWIGYETEATPPTVTTSETDLVSVTVTVGADRMLKITGRGSVIDGDNNSTGGIIFVEESTTDLGRIHRHPDLTEQSFCAGCVLIDGPSAGAHTYKLVGQCTTNEFTFFAGIDIIVEDVGPASLMAWLDDHPPSRSQFRDPRRAQPSGVICVHTAENVMDVVGPDTGAESVARFIQTRDTPGSYHDLVDSDSFLQLVRYTCEAFHDATGSNPHSYGLSFACRTTDWVKMGPTKRAGFIENGAARAVVYAQWVKSQYGIDIPARRISRAESENRLPGFISHAQRDPARRTDPGSEFPWRRFLDRYQSLLKPLPPRPPTTEDDDMAVAVKGNQSPAVYATNWIHKNHIPSQAQLQQMMLTGLGTDGGDPFVVDQPTIDAIPDAE